MMPEMDGVDVCRKVREAPSHPFTYIIMLTAKGQKEDIVNALNAGADDYVTKPWDASELRARVAVGERIVRLNTALEEANRQLDRMASTDALTGLFNRRTIMERLAQELHRAEREHRPLTVIMVDIDHFKRVNDTHGHTAGDRVLAEAARRLRSVCRDYDIVGRYGGEEFVCITPGSQGEDAAAAAERFRNAVGETPIAAEGAELDVTISVGGVWLAGDTPCDVDEVMKAADTLLYQAKEEGRNRSVVHEFSKPGAA
ncbi:MAG: diguanylate cyclase, partial [Candidatus Hydrogenedentes bacterium]|nr:diguanylate cyclase [Candidatus Hydrogenedentota bacterium]